MISPQESKKETLKGLKLYILPMLKALSRSGFKSDILFLVCKGHSLHKVNAFTLKSWSFYSFSPQRWIMHFCLKERVRSVQEIGDGVTN